MMVVLEDPTTLLVVVEDLLVLDRLVMVLIPVMVVLVLT
tara:strand:+ start:315 stop:431 length:117 start_codon:yes stop_codon:yes gene_type:complete